jgi:hypothetical protein
MHDPLGFLPPRTPGIFGTPTGLKVSAPFCRVIGFIEPVRDSHIGFEVWLPPESGWNGNYLAVGNPAFEGAIKYAGLAGALEQGYATASTDTGHLDPGHRGGEQSTRDFLRLFMVPDMGMCPGMNPATFDVLSALRHWREQGVAPDQITVSHANDGLVYKTRPVCVYPRVAIYQGSGDSNEAASFRCGVPDW